MFKYIVNFTVKIQKFLYPMEVRKLLWFLIFTSMKNKMFVHIMYLLHVLMCVHILHTSSQAGLQADVISFVIINCLINC